MNCNKILFLLIVLLLSNYVKSQWGCHYHYDCQLNCACYMYSYGSFCASKCNFANENFICNPYYSCVKSSDESETDDFVCIPENFALNEIMKNLK
uniref:Hypotheticial protein n=1 Tax=Strongyloides stercoralis TaxID=6248 RepID=A0A0K0EDI3_STRER